MNSIVLSLIERNESKVLPRSLGSFAALASDTTQVAYVIHDGGSSDNSVAVAEKCLDKCLGSVIVRPQPDPLDDFAGARNAVLDEAKEIGDWVYAGLDADDEIVTAPGFVMPELDPSVGCYQILVKNGGTEFWRNTILRSNLPWHWVGRMHECVVCDAPYREEKLHGIWLQVHPGQGARSRDPIQKFRNDAMVLRKCLAEDPGNNRYLFYLAQSLRDAGDHEESLKVYQERAECKGAWEEETWFAMREIARIKSWLERPIPEVMEAFLAAHAFRPCRAESLGMLSEYLRFKKHYVAAAHFARQAMFIPRPDDILFLIPEWYEWRAADECAISSFYAGRPVESRALCLDLLSNPLFPASHRARILENLRFANEALEVPQ